MLLEDRIVVLDAAPPFARVFDLQGRHLTSAIPRGDGPGELQRPLSIGRFDAYSYLVKEAARLLQVSLSGEVLATHVDTDRMLRGAIGCAGDLLLLSTAPGFQEPGRLTRAPAGAPALEDTLVRLDSIRSNSRRSHPLLAHATAETAVLYTEEVSRSRLIRFDCRDGGHEEIELPPLGRQEFWEPLGDGRQALHPAAAPLPAGVVTADGALLWARQEEVAAADALDSVTVVTLITGGDTHEAHLDGWYHLADSFGGRILLLARVPVSHAVLLDRDGFVRAIIESGVRPERRPDA